MCTYVRMTDGKNKYTGSLHNSHALRHKKTRGVVGGLLTTIISQYAKQQYTICTGIMFLTTINIKMMKIIRKITAV